MDIEVPPVPPLPPDVTSRVSGDGLEPPQREQRRWRPPFGFAPKQLIFDSIALIVVLSIGGAAGALIATAVIGPRIDSLARDLRETSADLDTARNGVKAAVDAKTKAEKQFADAQSEILDKQNALTQRENDVKAREDAVSQTEQRIAASSFGGGVRVVGVDIEPGQYRTDGTASCYYAWKSGTGADADIVDNNIVEGPATVTLRDGDVFENSRCGTWRKIG